VGQPVFPEVEPGEGRVAIEMKHPKPRPGTKQVDQMAIHFSYNQTYIPLVGSIVLVVAPTPRNLQAAEETYEVDYERVRAFTINPGQAVLIDKGVWHNSFMFGAPECSYINVTRKNPGEGRSLDAAGKVELVHARRAYVGFVDLPKRDNRVIELE
jgi:ureidoglycolate hydrolase